MPKAPSSSSSQRRTYTIAAILLLSKVMFPLYSYYAKERLLYIVIAAPFSCQPSSYSKCIKLNV